MKFVKFLRIPFSTVHLGKLLFKIRNGINLFKDFLVMSLAKINLRLPANFTMINYFENASLTKNLLP